jgi:hypothetical protein
MRDLELALTVMTAVVAGVALFAAVWYPIERRQREKRTETRLPEARDLGRTSTLAQR